VVDVTGPGIRANIDGLMAAVNATDWGGLIAWILRAARMSEIELC
jgi:hypothetical protein